MAVNEDDYILVSTLIRLRTADHALRTIFPYAEGLGLDVKKLQRMLRDIQRWDDTLTRRVSLPP